MTGDPAECTAEVCITCSDEGRVAEVRSMLDASRAEVMLDGRVETVDVSLVDPVNGGDLVLVHAGVAIAVSERTRS